jgi:Glyoxalase-like domain
LEAVKMPNYLRLRQICLAAPRLAPVIDDLQAIFKVQVCYRDPNVGHFGLENALIPIGTDFLEVVAPIKPDTAASRFISRTRGHGGYMAIFQTDTPRQRQAHAQSLGVRTAHEIERDAYQSAQLHPRDVRATFIELGHSTGGDDRMGTWWPAGNQWQQSIRIEHCQRMLGIELESPDPQGLASHWSSILQTPQLRDDGAAALRFEDSTIRFVNGATECLGAIVVQVAEPAATLERALNCGYRLSGDSFHCAGVNFRVKA